MSNLSRNGEEDAPTSSMAASSTLERTSGRPTRLCRQKHEGEKQTGGCRKSRRQIKMTNSSSAVRSILQCESELSSEDQCDRVKSYNDLHHKEKLTESLTLQKKLPKHNLLNKNQENHISPVIKRVDILQTKMCTGNDSKLQKNKGCEQTSISDVTKLSVLSKEIQQVDKSDCKPASWRLKRKSRYARESAKASLSNSCCSSSNSGSQERSHIRFRQEVNLKNICTSTRRVNSANITASVGLASADVSCSKESFDRSAKKVTYSSSIKVHGNEKEQNENCKSALLLTLKNELPATISVLGNKETCAVISQSANCNLTTSSIKNEPVEELTDARVRSDQIEPQPCICHHSENNFQFNISCFPSHKEDVTCCGNTHSTHQSTICLTNTTSNYCSTGCMSPTAVDNIINNNHINNKVLGTNTAIIAETFTPAILSSSHEECTHTTTSNVSARVSVVPIVQVHTGSLSTFPAPASSDDNYHSSAETSISIPNLSSPPDLLAFCNLNTTETSTADLVKIMNGSLSVSVAEPSPQPISANVDTYSQFQNTNSSLAKYAYSKTSSYVPAIDSSLFRINSSTLQNTHYHESPFVNKIKNELPAVVPITSSVHADNIFHSVIRTPLLTNLEHKLGLSHSETVCNVIPDCATVSNASCLNVSSSAVNPSSTIHKSLLNTYSMSLSSVEKRQEDVSKVVPPTIFSEVSDMNVPLLTPSNIHLLSVTSSSTLTHPSDCSSEILKTTHSLPRADVDVTDLGSVRVCSKVNQPNLVPPLVTLPSYSLGYTVKDLSTPPKCEVLKNPSVSYSTCIPSSMSTQFQPIMCSQNEQFTHSSSSLPVVAHTSIDQSSPLKSSHTSDCVSTAIPKLITSSCNCWHTSVGSPHSHKCALKDFQNDVNSRSNVSPPAEVNSDEYSLPLQSSGDCDSSPCHTEPRCESGMQERITRESHQPMSVDGPQSTTGNEMQSRSVDFVLTNSLESLQSRPAVDLSRELQPNHPECRVPAAKISLDIINEHFVCKLCKGYFVDATTVVVCQHTFCRSCIVRYLEHSMFCPECEVLLHKAAPKCKLRPDPTLQALLYTLLPQLYYDEKRRRECFYNARGMTEPPPAGPLLSSEHPEAVTSTPVMSVMLHSDDVCVQLVPCHHEVHASVGHEPALRYIQCPAALSIWQLKRLLKAKFCLNYSQPVVILVPNYPKMRMCLRTQQRDECRKVHEETTAVGVSPNTVAVSQTEDVTNPISTTMSLNDVNSNLQKVVLTNRTLDGDTVVEFCSEFTPVPKNVLLTEQCGGKANYAATSPSKRAGLLGSDKNDFQQCDYLQMWPGMLLLDNETIRDVAYIQNWNREKPLQLFYKIFQRQKKKSSLNTPLASSSASLFDIPANVINQQACCHPYCKYLPQSSKDCSMIDIPSVDPKCLLEPPSAVSVLTSASMLDEGNLPFSDVADRMKDESPKLGAVDDVEMPLLEPIHSDKSEKNDSEANRSCDKVRSAPLLCAEGLSKWREVQKQQIRKQEKCIQEMNLKQSQSVIPCKSSVTKANLKIEKALSAKLPKATPRAKVRTGASNTKDTKKQVKIPTKTSSVMSTSKRANDEIYANSSKCAPLTSASSASPVDCNKESNGTGSILVSALSSQQMLLMQSQHFAQFQQLSQVQHMYSIQQQQQHSMSACTPLEFSLNSLPVSNISQAVAAFPSANCAASLMQNVPSCTPRTFAGLSEVATTPMSESTLDLPILSASDFNMASLVTGPGGLLLTAGKAMLPDNTVGAGINLGATFTPFHLGYGIFPFVSPTLDSAASGITALNTGGGVDAVTAMNNYVLGVSGNVNACMTSSGAANFPVLTTAPNDLTAAHNGSLNFQTSLLPLSYSLTPGLMCLGQAANATEVSNISLLDPNATAGENSLHALANSVNALQVDFSALQGMETNLNSPGVSVLTTPDTHSPPILGVSAASMDDISSITIIGNGMCNSQAVVTEAGSGQSIITSLSNYSTAPSDVYNNTATCNPDALLFHNSEPSILQVDSKFGIEKSLENFTSEFNSDANLANSNTLSTDSLSLPSVSGAAKNTEWKEVQLKISECGIMSVSSGGQNDLMEGLMRQVESETCHLLSTIECASDTQTAPANKAVASMPEHCIISAKFISSENVKVTEPTTSGNTKVTEPITSENSKVTEPITSKNSKVAEPRTSENSKVTEPITSENSKATEPITSENLKAAEPRTSENSKVTEPITSENSKVTESTTSENSKATEPITSENSKVTESTTSENSKATEPTTSENSKVTEPTTSENAKVTEPTTSENSKVTNRTVSKNLKVCEPTVSENAKIIEPAICKNSKVSAPAVAISDGLCCTSTSVTCSSVSAAPLSDCHRNCEKYIQKTKVKEPVEKSSAKISKPVLTSTAMLSKQGIKSDEFLVVSELDSTVALQSSNPVGNTVESGSSQVQTAKRKTNKPSDKEPPQKMTKEPRIENNLKRKQDGEDKADNGPALKNIKIESTVEISQSTLDLKTAHPVQTNVKTLRPILNRKMSKLKEIADKQKLVGNKSHLSDSFMSLSDICDHVSSTDHSKGSNGLELRADHIPASLTAATLANLKTLNKLHVAPQYGMLSKKQDGKCDGTRSPARKSQSVGYKTLNISPRGWNPTISREHIQIGVASSTSSPKTNKFFKARNAPRYFPTLSSLKSASHSLQRNESGSKRGLSSSKDGCSDSAETESKIKSLVNPDTASNIAANESLNSSCVDRPVKRSCSSVVVSSKSNSPSVSDVGSSTVVKTSSPVVSSPCLSLKNVSTTAKCTHNLLSIIDSPLVLSKPKSLVAIIDKESTDKPSLHSEVKLASLNSAKQINTRRGNAVVTSCINTTVLKSNFTNTPLSLIDSSVLNGRNTADTGDSSLKLGKIKSELTVSVPLSVAEDTSSDPGIKNDPASNDKISLAEGINKLVCISDTKNAASVSALERAVSCSLPFTASASSHVSFTPVSVTLSNCSDNITESAHASTVATIVSVSNSSPVADNSFSDCSKECKSSTAVNSSLSQSRDLSKDSSKKLFTGCPATVLYVPRYPRTCTSTSKTISTRSCKLNTVATSTIVTSTPSIDCASSSFVSNAPETCKSASSLELTLQKSTEENNSCNVKPSPSEANCYNDRAVNEGKCQRSPLKLSGPILSVLPTVSNSSSSFMPSCSSVTGTTCRNSPSASTHLLVPSVPLVSQWTGSNRSSHFHNQSSKQQVCSAQTTSTHSVYTCASAHSSVTSSITASNIQLLSTAVTSQNNNCKIGSDISLVSAASIGTVTAADSLGATSSGTLAAASSLGTTSSSTQAAADSICAISSSTQPAADSLGATSSSTLTAASSLGATSCSTKAAADSLGATSSSTQTAASSLGATSSSTLTTARSSGATSSSTNAAADSLGATSSGTQSAADSLGVTSSGAQAAADSLRSSTEGHVSTKLSSCAVSASSSSVRRATVDICVPVQTSVTKVSSSNKVLFPSMLESAVSDGVLKTKNNNFACGSLVTCSTSSKVDPNRVLSETRPSISQSTLSGSLTDKSGLKKLSVSKPTCSDASVSTLQTVAVSVKTSATSLLPDSSVASAIKSFATGLSSIHSNHSCMQTTPNEKVNKTVSSSIASSDSTNDMSSNPFSHFHSNYHMTYPYLYHGGLIHHTGTDSYPYMNSTTCSSYPYNAGNAMTTIPAVSSAYANTSFNSPTASCGFDDTSGKSQSQSCPSPSAYGNILTPSTTLAVASSSGSSVVSSNQHTVFDSLAEQAQGFADHSSRNSLCSPYVGSSPHVTHSPKLPISPMAQIPKQSADTTMQANYSYSFQTTSPQISASSHASPSALFVAHSSAPSNSFQSQPDKQYNNCMVQSSSASTPKYVASCATPSPPKASPPHSYSPKLQAAQTTSNVYFPHNHYQTPIPRISPLALNASSYSNDPVNVISIPVSKSLLKSDHHNKTTGVPKTASTQVNDTSKSVTCTSVTTPSKDASRGKSTHKASSASASIKPKLSNSTKNNASTYSAVDNQMLQNYQMFNSSPYTLSNFMSQNALQQGSNILDPFSAYGFSRNWQASCGQTPNNYCNFQSSTSGRSIDMSNYSGYANSPKPPADQRSSQYSPYNAGYFNSSSSTQSDSSTAVNAQAAALNAYLSNINHSSFNPSYAMSNFPYFMPNSFPMMQSSWNSFPLSKASGGVSNSIDNTCNVLAGNSSVNSYPGFYYNQNMGYSTGAFMHNSGSYNSYPYLCMPSLNSLSSVTQASTKTSSVTSTTTSATSTNNPYATQAHSSYSVSNKSNSARQSCKPSNLQGNKFTHSSIANSKNVITTCCATMPTAKCTNASQQSLSKLSSACSVTMSNAANILSQNNKKKMSLTPTSSLSSMEILDGYSNSAMNTSSNLLQDIPYSVSSVPQKVTPAAVTRTTPALSSIVSSAIQPLISSACQGNSVLGNMKTSKVAVHAPSMSKPTSSGQSMAANSNLSLGNLAYCGMPFGLAGINSCNSSNSILSVNSNSFDATKKQSVTPTSHYVQPTTTISYTSTTPNINNSLLQLAKTDAFMASLSSATSLLLPPAADISASASNEANASSVSSQMHSVSPHTTQTHQSSHKLSHSKSHSPKLIPHSDKDYTQNGKKHISHSPTLVQSGMSLSACVGKRSASVAVLPDSVTKEYSSNADCTPIHLHSKSDVELSNPDSSGTANKLEVKRATKQSRKNSLFAPKLIRPSFSPPLQPGVHLSKQTAAEKSALSKPESQCNLLASNFSTEADKRDSSNAPEADAPAVSNANMQVIKGTLKISMGDPKSVQSSPSTASSDSLTATKPSAPADTSAAQTVQTSYQVPLLVTSEPPSTNSNNKEVL